jgi:hypothetical protein
MIAGEQGKLLESGERLIRSLVAFLRLKDQHLAGRAFANFKVTFDRASHAEQQALKTLWQKAGLGDWPE